MTTEPVQRARIPRDKENDYTAEAATKRREFVAEQTGAQLEHVGGYTFDAGTLKGNVENFIGAAQVPIGLAGPLQINGEHAQGQFYIPMATTEGTLVASYSRGMRLLSESGGVRTTVVDEAMQRSPVWVFDNALQARDFGHWVDEHIDDIRTAAQATTTSGKLTHVGHYQIGKLHYLRVNYTTGDAAGQNMTGKATLAACVWIQENHPDHPYFILSGNMDTDKKHSQINMLLTRGRRVVAEAVVKREVLRDLMRVDSRELFRARQISTAGAFLAGSANSGSHAANGLAAMFIATGQDAANVSESHAGVVYNELLENGDIYWSITLPALIVATYGGGTGLATQRECLQMLDCVGSGKVNKFAEICAGVVLAGETSLGAAVVAGDWVSSHDQYGRNRK